MATTEAEKRIEDRIIALQGSVDLLMQYVKLFDQSQKERTKIVMDYLSDLLVLESKTIRETVVKMHELAAVHSELVLAPPAVCDALDDLISIVELMPEAQDPRTDLWASVFTARESLRSATLSEPKEQGNGV
jgi:hypothetical protein